MKLTDTFTDEYEYKGNVLKLKLSFDNVLKVLELLEDELFSKTEKLAILYQMLVKNANEVRLSLQEVNDLIGFVFDSVLFPKSEDNSKDTEKYFDFQQDAPIIYASFLQEYKIDLFEMQGVLHWQKFLALLDNLSDSSRFKEVVGIRKQKIPPLTKYNKEERKRLIELKRIYKLKGEKTSVESADQRLMAFSQALKKSYMKGR